MKKLALVFLVIVASIALSGARDTSSEHLITVTDLQAASEYARENGLVLMLGFSSDYCPYCVRLEEEYLKPMLRSAEYKDKVMIRRFDLGGYTNITNFDGRSMSPSQFASQYGAYVTPTLIFVNHKGEELAEKLVGLGTEGFFAAYIDQHIAQARSNL